MGTKELFEFQQTKWTDTMAMFSTGRQSGKSMIALQMMQEYIRTQEILDMENKLEKLGF